ncbi:hypothetical protein [Shinella zoogloeoides]|uniref:hypothetical protein n=1 Tax=Shinella zoogloeoides TaxID=352475 RepID=UPI001F57124C|nr:hypothetical protein [Shinella zoogloeoides]
MARRDRTRRAGDRLGFFTVAYYGTGNRFILAETLKAYSIENANERAERAMPPGAVTYEVTDNAARGR